MAVSSAPYRILGRYALFDELAAGGMATVHLGRLLGPVGFARTVAVKRLHAQYARDAEFVAMFLDEARLAARIQHPNVVSTIDVFQAEGELFLVMDYIRGETLSHLARAASIGGGSVPIDVATSVVAGALYGLHAAHDAVNERGEPLHIVHRDVSPQNIMLGTDGVPRVLDFGVAKAASRLQSTRGGQLKGKLAYMAPEQLHAKSDRRTDVYSAGVVLWELLTGKRLFDGENEAALVLELMRGCQTPPSHMVPAVPRALDEIVMCALALDPAARFPTARDMAVALERAVRPATARELGEWVERVAGASLTDRLRRVAEIESMSAVLGGAQSDSRAFATTMRDALQPALPAAVANTSPSWGSGPSSSPTAPARGTPWASSGITSQAMVATPTASGGGKMIAAFVAAMLGIALVGSLIVWHFASPSPASPTTSAPAASDAPSPRQIETSAPPASAPFPPAATSAALTATVPPPPTPPPSKTGRANAPPSTPPPAKPPKASCDPPFVYDANGVKRFKPECL